MIHLALILFMLVMVSPAEAKILGIAKTDDGRTVHLLDGECAKKSDQPMGVVEMRDKANIVIFEGCWYYNPQSQIVLIEWSDGDKDRVPMQAFKDVSEV